MLRKEWVGKNIGCFVRGADGIVKNGRRYSGTVEAVSDDGATFFVTIPELGKNPSTGEWWVDTRDAEIIN